MALGGADLPLRPSAAPGGGRRAARAPAPRRAGVRGRCALARSGRGALCLPPRPTIRPNACADPAKEARARAIFQRDPLPGLPERIDRRLRGRAGRRPAPHRPRAGSRRAQRRARCKRLSWSTATASSCCCRPSFSLGNALLWATPFVSSLGGGAVLVRASPEERRRAGRPHRRGGGRARRTRRGQQAA